MRKLDGTRRGSRSGRARALVVLLHGYGANGEDLIGLAEAWQEELPDAAFVAPDAPDALPQAGPGARQWFDLTFLEPDELSRGAARAAPPLVRFIDDELLRHGLEPDRLALVGFSQGTMMALHVGLRQPVPPAAIVGFSGLLTGPVPPDGAPHASPPVQLIHGEQDEIVPLEAMHMTREALAASQVAVEWHVRPDLGHGIDPEGVLLAGGFLARALRTRAAK